MSSILKPMEAVDVKVSRYDRTTGLLLAAIIAIGFLVAVMFVVWLSPQPAMQTGPVIPDGDWCVIEDDSADDPSDAEVVGFPVAQNPELPLAIEAVSDVVSKLVADVETGKQLGSTETGDDGNIGNPDIRQPDLPRLVPDAQRWKLTFQANDIQHYKRQLDFFGIQIGVLHSVNNKVWRISSLSGRPTVVESNREQESQTLHFGQRNRKLTRWDRAIARAALGSESKGWPLRLFFDAALREKITNLEREYLLSIDRRLSDVRQTHIRVEELGDQFQMVIVGCNF